jgi:hypothetical protein
MLIGLTGAARSGKDTVANWLIEHHGFTRVAFAGPIKDMVCALLSMTPEVLEEMKDHELPFLDCETPRRLLQTLGTEWGRDIINPNIWLAFAEERIGILRATGIENIVITDVRFENEAWLIKRLGGKIYAISRPNCPEVQGHISETGLPSENLDGRIYNSGTLDGLMEMLEDFSVTALGLPKKEGA